jgi:hypothetical protein
MAGVLPVSPHSQGMIQTHCAKRWEHFRNPVSNTEYATLLSEPFRMYSLIHLCKSNLAWPTVS